MLEVVQPTSPFHFSKTACIKNDQHQFRFYKISEIKQPSVEENRVEEGERGAEQSSRRTEHRGGREEQNRAERGGEKKRRHTCCWSRRTWGLEPLATGDGAAGAVAAGDGGWNCRRCGVVFSMLQRLYRLRTSSRRHRTPQRCHRRFLSRGSTRRSPGAPRRCSVAITTRSRRIQNYGLDSSHQKELALMETRLYSKSQSNGRKIDCLFTKNKGVTVICSPIFIYCLVLLTAVV